MVYETIIDAKLEKFKDAHLFNKLDNNILFEIYINHLFARYYRFIDCMTEYSKFDLSNVGGESDSGIDGIFIRINGSLIFSKEDIDTIVKNGSLICVDFIFIQSKNKTNIDSGEIAKFFSGIKNFMNDVLIDEVNDKISDWIELKNYLFSKDIISSFEKQPKVYAIYAYKGINQNDVHINSKIVEFEKDISGLQCANQIEVFDGEKIFELIKKVDNNFRKTISYFDSFELQDSENVSSSLILLCKANDLVDLLTDEDDGQLKRTLFSDNVRDYQGDTVVNREIYETIKDQPTKFCLYNNGITIVCNECVSTNRKITLTNPQIVNGCQTCTSLFNASKEGLPLNEINLIVKVIATNDSLVTNSVIKGTNRQNVVYSESFEITKEFHKNFEEYVKSIQTSFNSNEKIYYERRSNQLSADNFVCDNQKFNLKILIQSYVSTFLLEPHRGFEHEINLLERFQNRIFNEKDNYKSYFTAVLLQMYLERAFKENYEKYRYYGRYKYQIMAIFIHIVAGRIPDLTNNKKTENYCDKLLSIIRDKNDFLFYVDSSISKFDIIRKKWIDLKGEKFIHAIKDNSIFADFMFKELGFEYSYFAEKNKEDNLVHKGKVVVVKKDRNGMSYCFIKADPVDVFVHEDNSPKTIFNSLIGKEVLYKVLSVGRFNNPKGTIIKVFSRVPEE